MARVAGVAGSSAMSWSAVSVSSAPFSNSPLQVTNTDSFHTAFQNSFRSLSFVEYMLYASNLLELSSNLNNV
ncbi:hypothetical protein DL98DRAFT_125879 [Cadophora sp. DSE1049]|nr:hypothetical protein DL98DRAFT_125879 [Cadophora sp. DSE1049]